MELPPEVNALIERLRQELGAVRAELATLYANYAALQQEAADLRRRLNKDSSNSGKPPSSDGLAKKPRIAGSLRGVSDKKSGGQRGHQGDTLRPVADPDKIERHVATQCRHCQAALTATMATRVEKRQVFEMPQPRLEVTEHQASSYTCACCRGVTHAAFPPEVTAYVQYGPRIRAAAIYLNAQHLVPEDRVGDIMHDLFGAARLCPASIAAWSEQKAHAWAPLAAHIAGLITIAGVRHLDETGFRICGKTQWLHTASTAALTCYRVSGQRGAMPETLRGGVIVHDHFKPYFMLAEVEHALCNAHHLRELKALIDIEKEPWARKMSRLLVGAAKRVQRAIAQGKIALAAGCAAHRLGLRCDRPARAGLSCGATRAGAASGRPRPVAQAGRPQSSGTPARPQDGGAAVHVRLRRSLHQQSSRAGHPDDEGEDEDLRRLSQSGWCPNICHLALRSLHRP